MASVRRVIHLKTDPQLSWQGNPLSSVIIVTGLQLGFFDFWALCSPANFSPPFHLCGRPPGDRRKCHTRAWFQLSLPLLVHYLDRIINDVTITSKCASSSLSYDGSMALRNIVSTHTRLLLCPQQLQLDKFSKVAPNKKQEPFRAGRSLDLEYTHRSLEGFSPRFYNSMLPSAADNELQALANDGIESRHRSLSVPPIDPANARFPYCVVWTPLPVVAWLAPFVGHVGICREDGVILDFAGPFFVNVDNFAFGSTARYLRLDTAKCCFPPHPSAHTCEDGVSHATLGTGISWDDALRMGTHNYQHKSYNLFTCNCHSFTASCMNRLAYNGSIRWNVVDIGVMVFLKGRWISYGAIVRAFGPFFVVMAIGLLIAGWPFLIGWAAFSILLIAWFLIATYFMNEVIHC